MKRWMILIAALLIVAVPFVLAACSDDAEETTPAASPTPEPTQADIVDTAVAAGSFTTLTAAIEAAGLVDTLKGEGPFTVFAPTDDAFAALPEGTVDTLLEDPQGDLTQILTYHVVPGKVMSTDLSDGMTAATVQGAELTFTIKDGAVYVNDAMVITADIETANGVIHVIDSVLLPPAEEEAMMGKTIADIAAGDERFSTLVGALVSAELVDALKGEGPFTVFAPTDDAFAALPAGTLEALTPEQLKSILLYHVVPAKVMAADAVALDGQSAGTLLEGSEIAISVKDGKVFLNDTVEVVITDIVADNGVIHVISGVLLPPAE